MPKKDNQQGYYGFDPSGLERAAAVRIYKSYLSYRLLNILMPVLMPRMLSTLQLRKSLPNS